MTLLAKIRFLFRGLALAATITTAALPQTPVAGDNTVLKQIIIFGRHGIRSSAIPDSTLAAFSSRPYPAFSVPTGYLTPNGAQAELLLGSYFRTYLLNQGLLTANVKDDFNRSYFRANSIQRSNISASSLSAGLFPGQPAAVHSFPLGQPDPIFDPVLAQIGSVDKDRVQREINGIYGSGAALKASYSGEIALIRSLMFNYQPGLMPPPPAPQGLLDLATLPAPLTLNATLATSNIVNSGVLVTALSAADPFVMQYADGKPLSDVAWGQLTPDGVSQQTRIITAFFNLEMTSPYLSQVQSSNAASHVLRSIQQAANAFTLPGSFGDSSTKVIVVNSSDAYVVGLAALLHAHWLLPGYQPDYCPPGGSLVFELRQSSVTGEYFVRIYFTAQTFDQMRNLTPLTLDTPPATMQLAIPGASRDGSSLDISYPTFQQLVRRAIHPDFVQDVYAEVGPGVLTGVPLK